VSPRIYAGQRGFTDILILADANEEYSYIFPRFTIAFAIKARSLDEFKYSWQKGESGTKYRTAPKGTEYYKENIILDQYRTIYFQSEVPSLILEIEYWR
jgi:hypothetical protein